MRKGAEKRERHDQNHAFCINLQGDQRGDKENADVQKGVKALNRTHHAIHKKTNDKTQNGPSDGVHAKSGIDNQYEGYLHTDTAKKKQIQDQRK